MHLIMETQNYPPTPTPHTHATHSHTHTHTHTTANKYCIAAAHLLYKSRLYGHVLVYIERMAETQDLASGHLRFIHPVCSLWRLYLEHNANNSLQMVSFTSNTYFILNRHLQNVYLHVLVVDVSWDDQNIVALVVYWSNFTQCVIMIAPVPE